MVNLPRRSGDSKISGHAAWIKGPVQKLNRARILLPTRQGGWLICMRETKQRSCHVLFFHFLASTKADLPQK
jgi:hypothetical protein